MAHYTRILILSLILIFSSFYAQAQLTGDFRSKASGNWGDNTTWEVYTGTTWVDAVAGEFPGGTDETDADNVYLEAGFTVTLEASHSCKDLHLNTTEDVIRINTQSNILNVWGKMRFYEGVAPGAATPNPVTSSGVLGWISTSPDGSIRFRGTTDRVVMEQGEVNSNNNNSGWNMDFAFDAFMIGQINDRIRAENITVTSGELFMFNLSAELRVGTNSPGDITPNGSLIIKPGAVVRGGSGIFKNGTTPAQTITVEEGGTLTINRNGYVLAAVDLNLNGTVALQNTISFPTPAGRTSAEEVNTFNNISLEGSGTKTLSNNITVNGTLAMRGIALFSISTFTLTYGPSGELEYSGSIAQTTGNEEFPTVGGPSDLHIFNPDGVTLHESRTIPGQLTLTEGRLILGDNHLTLGENSPNIAGSPSSANMVVTSGTGELRKIFSSAGGFLFPVGETTGTAEFSDVQITVNSADALNSTTYVGIRVVDADHPANAAVNRISRYWSVSSNATNLNYDGTFQYLPGDVVGNINMLGGYLYSNESAAATATQLSNGAINQITETAITGTGLISASTFTPTGLHKEKSIAGLNIYPNPVKHKLIFDFDLKAYKEIQISVLKSTGEVLLREQADPMTYKALDVSSYTAGIYFVNIVLDDTKTVTYKIIKE